MLDIWKHTKGLSIFYLSARATVPSPQAWPVRAGAVVTALPFWLIACQAESPGGNWSSGEVALPWCSQKQGRIQGVDWTLAIPFPGALPAVPRPVLPESCSDCASISHVTQMPNLSRLKAPGPLAQATLIDFTQKRESTHFAQHGTRYIQ